MSFARSARSARSGVASLRVCPRGLRGLQGLRGLGSLRSGYGRDLHTRVFYSSGVDEVLECGDPLEVHMISEV